MDLKTRKRLSIFLLVLGLPGYIAIAWMFLGWLDDRYGRLPFLAELAVIVVLGLVWILPFRRIFTGIGKGEE